FENSKIHFDKAYLVVGISDLRGVSQNLDFAFNGKNFPTEIGKEIFLDNTLKINLLNAVTTENLSQKLNFKCNLKLNGSQSINFVPIAQTTQVEISGDWLAPSFVGAFLPNYKIDNQQFNAEWNVLSFNRSIPENWTDKLETNLRETSFGVNLVETVDHYQQNMRSAKYALMFIALTFVVFFFVEALTKKRIHPVQYLLVGIALILFYSLLLSFSEQIGFAWAYLVASVATISLITLYTKGIFRSGKQMALLAALLCLLYIFLYVVLQLEDLALVIGSIGLFAILGVIMFVSRKIKWYK
ncbi:MAG: cell envelope integrity protein CreD, partial [Paludibacter sp.]|nr:cell envelope integrity protein CreD [Paludibacter sp.]